MQKIKLILTATLFVIAVSLTGLAQSNHPASVDTAKNAPAGQARDFNELAGKLTAEIRSLKIELMKLQLEMQQGKLKQLENEFEQSRNAERGIEIQEQKMNQDVVAFDERLAETDLEPAERTQIEVSKAKLTQRSQQLAHTQKQQILERQAEINQRLAREQEIWQKMLVKAKGLGITFSESGQR